MEKKLGIMNIYTLCTTEYDLICPSIFHFICVLFNFFKQKTSVSFIYLSVWTYLNDNLDNMLPSFSVAQSHKLFFWSESYLSSQQI